mgnify:CR=1 FL=1
MPTVHTKNDALELDYALVTTEECDSEALLIIRLPEGKDSNDDLFGVNKPIGEPDSPFKLYNAQYRQGKLCWQSKNKENVFLDLRQTSILTLLGERAAININWYLIALSSKTGEIVALGAFYIVDSKVKA